MGFRFRKSFNLGGGFKINLSKSGVGYSWGVKDYRLTKTAKGTIRTTASISGTGISYIHETGKLSSRASQSKTNLSQSPSATIDNNHYDTQNIVNNVASEMISEGLEPMLASANKALKLKKITAFGFWITLILGFANPLFFVLTVLFAVIFICVNTKGVIKLDYFIEEDQQSIVNLRMNPMIRITECSKVWRIMKTSKVIDRKYSGGASNTINRTACIATTKAPFPFKANVQVASFKAGKETLLFLPDKLFIIQGSKVGALNYSDVVSTVYATRFIESEGVPKDSQIVGRTWEYVNKSNGPDKRFKNNRELPICLYGKLELNSSSGLNTVIMFSNPNIND